MSFPARLARSLPMLLVVVACRAAATPPAMPSMPRDVPAAAPGEAAAAPADSARRGYTAADVRFMQHMIEHHGQALTMTALVAERSRNDAIRTIAERITVSQRDEMAMMRRWLEARHEVSSMESMEHAMPGMAHAGHDAMGGAGAPMPGMLTPAGLDSLAAATGPRFDALFLRDMIRHHEGALTMVASLFATPGAAQEPELFRLASDVDADQRAEIARMRALLASSASSASPQ